MEFLEGAVERVTFFNAENGYSVIRLTPARGGEVVTLIGNLPEVTPGESLRLKGFWTAHADYGRQFRVIECEQVLPATVEGIRRYLGSGLIKGVGPKTAERIVGTFGKDTLDVIEREPQRLREVPDIGPKRYHLIREAWDAQKHIKEVMVFLQGHGISTGLAVKIYKHYGDEALAIVRADPYRLARDIWGVGFKTADKIARALGLPADAPARLEAGIIFTLNELADEGHVYAPESALIETANNLLEVDLGLLKPAIQRLVEADRVKIELLAEAENAVYLTPFYQAERKVAERLRALLRAPSRLKNLQTAHAPNASLQSLSPEQQTAIQLALAHKVCALTGGPGTGKTTTLKALIQTLEKQHVRIALASPTGRAAKRLSEATGRPAQTLHRLLGFAPTGGFAHNEQNRLPAQFVVVDEASMIDLILMNNLLKALEPAAHLLLVGDEDQLPSVGAGNVLGDVIASGQVPVARLNTIFRQAAASHIVTNAHRINQGQLPVFEADSGDFFLFGETEPEAAAQRIVEVVQTRIPRKFGLSPDAIQVLAPMHRGAAGVGNLNTLLQAALNPPAPHKGERALGGRTLRLGDRLMQIRNNYQKEVFNGDIGRLVDVEEDGQRFTVEFDSRPIVYEWAEADELAHAFAVSIHKAQGSEFPAVVIPLLTQHFMMLQRNLLYTAITRAKQLCVLVGARKAIAIAVKNDNVAQRWTRLAERLSQKGDEVQSAFSKKGVRDGKN
jgi:exodeoxyribonuclease V alpha subunit